MKKFYLFIVFLCSLQAIYSQEDGVVSLALPIRNSLKYNKFLINPTFSFVREQSPQISFYNKRLWVQFENAPQTYLLSYAGRFKENEGIALGLFQQNYGVLTTFGAIANFSHNVILQEDSNLTFGMNLGFYKSGINSGKVITNYPDPSLENIPSNFLLTINPGVNYGTAFLDFGLSINNLVLYNFKTSKIAEDNLERSLEAHIMHTGYIETDGFFEQSKFSGLIKTEFKKDKTIISGLAMIAIPKGVWVQAGYNTLYGISGGIGLNITPKIAIEYNFEKGMGNLSNFGSSHEIVLAYKLKSKNYDYGDEEEEGSIIPTIEKRVIAKPTNDVSPLLSPVDAQKLREMKLALVAKKEEDRLFKLKEDAEAKLKADAVAKEKLTADAKLKAVADAKAKLAADAKLKADADAKTKLDADTKLKADVDAKAKLIADAKLKADAEAAAKAKLIADAKLKADAALQAKLIADAEAAAKAKLVADAKLKADAALQAKLIADAKLKSDAEAAAKAKQAADSKLKSDADAEAKLVADAKLKVDADAKAKLEADAKLKADTDAKAKLEADSKLKAAAELAIATKLATAKKDENAKSIDNLSKIVTDSKKLQQELLKQLDVTVASKEQDLKDLKEENDLSEKGIYKEPKAFRSVSAENQALETLKNQIEVINQAQKDKINEIDNLYNERLKKGGNKNDELSQFYLKSITTLKAEQQQAIQSNVNLISSLEKIKTATEIEKKRRIKRASFQNEQERFTKDKATLNRIKEATPYSSVALKSTDFDYGEEPTNMQIIKNVSNIEKGYYLIVAVHSDVAKRDDFLTKVVASGQSDINFFYDVKSGKYFIYESKFDSIDEAKNALDTKGNKPYNSKMSMVKIEND